MTLPKTTIYGDITLRGGELDTIGLFNINDILYDRHGVIKEISFTDSDGNSLDVDVKHIFTDDATDAFMLASVNNTGYDNNNIYVFRYNRLTRSATKIDINPSRSQVQCIIKAYESSTAYWFRFNATSFVLFNLDTLAMEPFNVDSTYVSSEQTASYNHTLTNYIGNLNRDDINNYLSNGVLPKNMGVYKFDSNNVCAIRIPITETMMLYIRLIYGNPFKLSMGTVELSSILSSRILTHCMSNIVISSHGTNSDDIILFRQIPIGKSITGSDYTKYVTVTQIPNEYLLIGANSFIAYTDSSKTERTSLTNYLLFTRDPDTSNLYLGITHDKESNGIYSSKCFIDKSTDFGVSEQIKGCLKLSDYDGFESVIIFATDNGIYRINYEYGFLYNKLMEIEKNNAPADNTILPDESRIRLFNIESTAGKLEAFTNDPIRRVFIAKYQNVYATYHYDKDVFYVYPSTPLEAEYRADAYYGLTGVLIVGNTANALYDECTIDADINNVGYLYLVNRVIELEKRVKALEK